jgi:hypothetical protein
MEVARIFHLPVGLTVITNEALEFGRLNSVRRDVIHINILYEILTEQRHIFL